MKVKRAVVDTNVLISAALSPKSVPARIVNILLGNARLVFSRETFDELATRLWRPKFDRYVDIDQRRVFLRHLTAVGYWVELPAAPAPALLPAYSRDPDDDVFLHTAQHGGAQWLVSGDQDLLEIADADWEFAILSPAQALQRWQP